MENEPKFLPNLETKFWAMLESNFHAKKAHENNVCTKIIK